MASAAQPSVSLEALEDRLSCGVCFHVYEDEEDGDGGVGGDPPPRVPKALPCLHTVCLACLRRLEENRRTAGGVVSCPICRQKVDVEGGVSTLKTNFALLELLPLMKQCPRPPQDGATSSVTYCGKHRKQTITHYCVDCAKGFCHKCFAETVRKASSHYGHQIEEYDVLRHSVIATIDENIATVKQVEEKVKQVSNTSVEKANANKLELFDSVEEQANDAIEMIEYWKKEIQKDIADETGQTVESIEQKKQVMLSHVTDVLKKLELHKAKASSQGLNSELVSLYGAEGVQFDLKDGLAELEQLGEPGIWLANRKCIDMPYLSYDADDAKDYLDETWSDEGDDRR